MIALLKKDIFVMDKQMRLLVILALLFNLIPSASSLGATYAMLIALMLPMSTISYDERCKWDRYARPGCPDAPADRGKQIVLS